MLAKITSAAVVGLDAVPITVEVDIAAMGLPSFTIVGLPDKAVEEAKRVAQPLKGLFRWKPFFISYNGNLTPDCIQ